MVHRQCNLNQFLQKKNHLYIHECNFLFLFLNNNKKFRINKKYIHIYIKDIYFETYAIKANIIFAKGGCTSIIRNYVYFLNVNINLITSIFFQ